MEIYNNRLKPVFIVTTSWLAATEMWVWYDVPVITYDGYYYIAGNQKAIDFIEENKHLQYHGMDNRES